MVRSGENPVLALLLREDFDPAIAVGEGLLIEHPDSTPEHQHSPLIVVSEGHRYRVTVAVFSKGEMQPSLSATYRTRDHQPVVGSSMFRVECDPEDAHEQLCNVVEATYVRSTKAERL